MADFQSLKHWREAKNAVKSVTTQYNLSYKVRSFKIQDFRWIEKLWQFLDVSAIMDQSACCYAWRHRKQVYKNTKIFHVFTLTVDIEKALYTLENIYQQIFRTKFHENLLLPGGVDSMFDSADSLLLNWINSPR